MDDQSLAAWVTRIASFASVDMPVVLDLGTGTGVFAAALAEVWKDGSVIGVDPSLAMIREARQRRAHPRVRYVLGDATALPLRDQIADLVLLSRVIHHLSDRHRAVCELARVTQAGSRIVIRTTVRERLDSLVYRYWPQLLEADQHRFPGADEITADFTRAGFRVVIVTSFSQPVASDLGAYRDRLRSRPQSKFKCLTNVQFREGLRRMDADVPTVSSPIEERYDVLVYERLPS